MMLEQRARFGVLAALVGIGCSGPMDNAAVIDAGTGGGGVPTGTGGAAGTSGTGGTAGVPPTEAGPPPLPRCTHPLMGDVFDPGEVYIAGMLAPRTCDQGLIAHWDCTEIASAGFPCHASSANTAAYDARIRASDGRLIFTVAGSSFLREFRCDDCPYSAAKGYPVNPLANDIVVPTDCGGSTFQSSRFLVSPSGLVLFNCLETATWRDATGQITYSEGTDELLALGYGGLALTRTRVLDLTSGQSFTIVGLPTSVTGPVRAVPPNKFWVVASNGSALALWEVDAAGATTQIGQYGPQPTNLTRPSGPAAAKLDQSGAFFDLYQSLPPANELVVVRRDLTGRSDWVYIQGAELLPLYSIGLVSGP